MKSQRLRTSLGMVVMAVGAVFVAACVEPGDDKALATEQAVTVNEVELPAAATTADGEEPAARVPCRRVTASVINVFSAPSGGTVRCQFFRNDVFSHFGQVVSTGRFITWCPRGVPPAQGTTSYAQSAGTVDGGCPP